MATRTVSEECVAPTVLSLDPVGADMRAIFGSTGTPPASARAEIRGMAQPALAQRRSSWPRLGTALLGGSLAGAAIGWWVLAAPQPQPARTRAIHAAAMPRATAMLAAPAFASAPPADGALPASVAPALSSPAEDGGEAPEPGRRPMRRAPALAYAAAPAPALSPTVEVQPAFRAVPAPAAPSPPLQVVPRPMPVEARRADDGCARYVDACTGADVRDAERQVRRAYAAAVDARVDPQALAQVRRRWMRMEEADAGQPDRLVTDYARLAGRLDWLAGDAADDPE